jgi:hypothetical protein
MKDYFKPVLALATALVFFTASVTANSEEKMMIAVQTDDFTLAETDVSELAIGESQSIETDSGKIIDVLRTSDGVELYIDGELLEVDLVNEGLHKEHMLENLHEIERESDLEISCHNDADESDCGERVLLISDGEGHDLDELLEMHVPGEGSQIIVIEKEVITED